MNTDLSQRAALYVRLSKEDKDGKRAGIDSIAVQKADGTEAIRAQGWDLAGVFVDDDVSGRTVKRDGWGDMIAAASRGEFSILVARDLDRVARYEPARQMATLIDLFDRGVRVWTYKDCAFVKLSGAESIVTYARAIASEQYVESLRVNTRAGLRRRGLEGRAIQVPALGYRIEDQGAQGKRWVIVPEEREVVLRIGRAFVKCGSLHGVAIDLNKQGVPAPRGGTWRRNSVHVILTRPIYRGYYTHGDLTVLHPELRIWPADLEAEIDRLLARPTRPWGTKTRHLSTRFVRCGECGGCLLSTQAQRGARHYLVCSRKRYHACDGIGARSEKAVDDAIISAVTSIVSDDVWARTKEILRAALEDQCKADQQEAEVDRLRREVQAAERRTRNLTESVAEAETRDERAPLLQALKAETQRVEGLKGALKAAEAALSSEGPESVLEAAEKRVEELRATLARGGPEAAPAVAAILGDDHFRARRLPDGMWELRAQGTLATLFAELSNGGPPPGRPSSLPSREKKTKKV